MPLRDVPKRTGVATAHTLKAAETGHDDLAGHFNRRT